MIRIFTILFLLLPQLSLQQEEGYLHPTESFLLTFESEAEQQEGGVGGEEEGLDTFMMKLIKNECVGPLTYKLLQSTALSSQLPAESVLILGEENGLLTDNGVRNYWLAERQKTTGQGFIFRIDFCKRLIAGFQIKNIGIGENSHYATDQFQIFGSSKENGPWKMLADYHLADTRGKAAPLLNFTFDQPVEIQFIRFELVSYWGANGGGLQYFAAIPATIDCNVTTWTEWTGCCDKERRRTRTAVREGQCKSVSVSEGCTEDNCPAGSAIATTGGKVTSCEECNNNNILLNVVIGLATLSGVLLLLLIGVVYLIYKMWSTARNAIKRDFNPVYGIDYEGEEAKNEDPRPQSVDQQYDYMG